MKIRVKVKNLLLVMLMIVILYFWGIPQATLGIANYLDTKNSDKAQLYYEKYADTRKSISSRLIFAESLVDHFSRFVIYSQGWGGGNGVSQEQMEKAEEVLRLNLGENPSKSELKDYVSSYRMLMDMAIAEGSSNKLKELIEWGEKSNNAEVKEISSIYTAFLHTINRDFSKAERIIEGLENTGSSDPRLQIIRGEMALFKGDIEEATRIYDELGRRSWKELDSSYFGSRAYLDRKFWLEQASEHIGEDGFIEGRILFEGKPMAFVEIYLQYADGGFRAGGDGYIAITDENGYFKSIGLKKGLYDIGVGTLESILVDKVFSRIEPGYVEVGEGITTVDFKFRNTIKVLSPQPGTYLDSDELVVRWEEVPGAAYYTVEPVAFFDPINKSGGYFRRAIESVEGEIRFTSDSAKFKVSKLLYAIGGLSRDGDDWIIGPEAVLGMFLPGVEYPITVNAYTKDNGLITSSLPMRTYYDSLPSVIMPGELSEGQRLVAEMKYPEAIQHYEDILIEDPEDVEAITSLAKLYGLGWKRGEKNLDRAFDLSDSIMESGIRSNILNIILQEMTSEEIIQNEKIVLEVIESLDNLKNDDLRYTEFRFHRAKKDWKAARAALEKLESYVPDTLVFLDIYFEDYDKALERLRDKRFYPSRLQGSIFTDAVAGLKENPPSSSDLSIFREFIERLIGDGTYENSGAIYTSTTGRLRDKNLRTIIDEIYNQRHWNQ
ncbi:hypothetical protein [Gudongella oleilytica]|uniref:hypothetical protein n=1 Tax=Gudongella oleilytica TaxID=1582259 RepID=UPI002A36FF03|nr:hypothetical protein [Gudongella oleilytica]MDY0257855.1 hypothetical protein [Gudongella oleilytica]